VDLKKQLAVARDIQSWLLPQKLPRVSGFDFDAAYDAADTIAGDLYDFIPHEMGAIGFFLAESTEPGVPAALAMAHVRGLVRAIAVHESNPPYLLKELNAQLLTDLRKATFVTALSVKLVPKSRSLLVACAGHTPLLIVRARSGEVQRVQPPGVALGSAMPDSFNPLMEGTSVLLAPGDRFVMVTDGVPGARDPRGREYGLDRLADRVAEYASNPSATFTARLLEDLRRHRAGGTREDDLTIVTGRLLPAI
jgi:serine phosphatase RsbU (regulator of sigma subunit)